LSGGGGEEEAMDGGGEWCGYVTGVVGEESSQKQTHTVTSAGSLAVSEEWKGFELLIKINGGRVRIAEVSKTLALLQRREKWMTGWKRKADRRKMN
jgi:hypothetical protein